MHVAVIQNRSENFREAADRGQNKETSAQAGALFVLRFC